jgi:ATP-dependent helicase IRC3
MSIALRDYQLEAINAVTFSFREGVNRQLISLPTGSGKTVVMAALAMQLNKKTILLAHREELIIQAVDKFKLVWPEVSIGVCMADCNEIDCQVVIGSVQSCSRPKRLAKLKELGFELMMIDEAHHSVSDSYQTVINELGFTK